MSSSYSSLSFIIAVGVAGLGGVLFSYGQDTVLDDPSGLGSSRLDRVMSNVDPAGDVTVEPAEVTQRLALLLERLERRQEQLHISGMAIAVVRDDKLTLARGFGLADIERKIPVVPETIFPIGSATKPFTATLAAVLVDQGKMSWDDPVTKYLPQFVLRADTPDGTDQVTVRDLLCHRTGFGRMNLLASAIDVTRAELLHAAARAAPVARFRQAFEYNNVMYVAAGVAIGEADGTNWDVALTRHLLQPLGMNNSRTSVHQVARDSVAARGYRWDEDHATWQLVPTYTYESMGPGMAMASSVVDLAQWLRFQLGRGMLDGRRLLSTAQHKETWTSQIEIGDNVAYGLGWFVRDWRGHTLIEHSGNTLGSSAQIGMLPELNIGYVILFNVGWTPLQNESVDLVFGSLVGEQTGKRKPDESRDGGARQPEEEAEPSPPEKPEDGFSQTAQIHVLGRGAEREAALEALEPLRLQGTVRVPQAGLDGKITWTIAGAREHRLRIDFGKLGGIHWVVNHDRVCDQSFLSFGEMRGKFLIQAQRLNPAVLLGDWTNSFDAIRIVRSPETMTAEEYVVELHKYPAPPMTVTVNSATKDVRRLETMEVRPGFPEFPLTLEFADYRSVEGIRIPHRIVWSGFWTGRMCIQVEQVETRLTLEEGFFSCGSGF